MKKYIVEFIGTFFLVLAVVLAVNGGVMGDYGGLAAIPIGLTLMVMIYAGGHISGAHYNPAVTLAVFMRGKCDASDVPMYMIAQVLGGAAAAGIGMGVFGAQGAGTGTHEILPALVGEILGTFALCWVVLQSATADKTSGNWFYGASIGLTVTAMAFILGGFSGGAFNPAVAIGNSIAGGMNWAEIWIYLVGCFGGGALAAIAYKMANSDD